jgi:hypothetical protein
MMPPIARGVKPQGIANNQPRRTIASGSGAWFPRGGPPGFPRRPDCNWLGRKDISRYVKESLGLPFRLFNLPKARAERRLIKFNLAE